MVIRAKKKDKAGAITDCCCLTVMSFKFNYHQKSSLLIGIRLLTITQKSMEVGLMEIERQRMKKKRKREKVNC